MTLEGLAQQVEDLEKATIERHRRSGEKIAELKLEIDRIGAEQRATAHTLGLLQERPLDATKLMLSTKAILAMVAACITIAASYWNLSTKLDTQQRDAEKAARIQEVQMKALGDVAADAKAAAADAKRQYELLRYEFQDLKETMIAKRGKP